VIEEIKKRIECTRRICFGFRKSILCFVFLGLFHFSPINSWGFGDQEHSEITEQALPFLRTEILNQLVDGNHDEDTDTDFWHAENHFDACEFDDSTENIQGKYNDLIGETVDRGNYPFQAAWTFGELLHPAQDFYSHSNCVELGKELGKNYVLENGLSKWPRLVQWTQLPYPDSDLVIAQGIRSSDTTLPPFYRNAPHWLPEGWSMTSDITPLVNDGRGGSAYGLFTHARGFGGNQCPHELQGWGHDLLNKDDSSPGTQGEGNYGGDLASYTYFYEQAQALAAAQTRHEWCRYLNLLKLDPVYGFEAVSIPMALWVKEDGNPHLPAANPERAPKERYAGNIGLTISISSILVKDDSDSGNDPGELKLGFYNLCRRLEKFWQNRSWTGPDRIMELLASRAITIFFIIYVS
jgi:hypothetical protein